jgi:hypothetical protein
MHRYAPIIQGRLSQWRLLWFPVNLNRVIKRFKLRIATIRDWQVFSTPRGEKAIMPSPGGLQSRASASGHVTLCLELTSISKLFLISHWFEGRHLEASTSATKPSKKSVKRAHMCTKGITMDQKRSGLGGCDGLCRQNLDLAILGHHRVGHTLFRSRPL